MTGPTPGRPRRPELREVAPDFTVVNSEGTPRRLHDMVRDQLLVLLFYRGHW